MNERLKRLFSRFLRNVESRTQIEKLFLLAVVAIGVLLAYLTYIHDPLRADISSAENQISSVTAQIASERTNYADKLAESQQDPDKFASDRLAAVTQQQQDLLDEIANLAGNLITPSQMTAILSSVLGRQSGLELVSFTNEEAKPLSADLSLEESAGSDSAFASTPAGRVYEHGLTMQFEGDFFNTLRYLRFLEGISGSFFWDSISFEQTEWPRALVTLRIHTLSTEAGFIGV